MIKFINNTEHTEAWGAHAWTTTTEAECYCDICKDSSYELYDGGVKGEICGKCLLGMADTKEGTCEYHGDDCTVYYDEFNGEWLCEDCFLDRADRVEIEM